jgi:hypothetical protein
MRMLGVFNLGESNIRIKSASQASGMRRLRRGLD